jgi:uncharacterized protein YndB with AHSA1/START domain
MDELLEPGTGAPAGPPDEISREVLIEATPEEVWESLATEAGRDSWLDDPDERRVSIELEEPPSRLVWWWSVAEGLPTRVEFLIVAAPGGTRVLVTETAPEFPIVMFATSCRLVAA